MRAAVVSELGKPPALVERPDPEGEGKAIVEFAAAGVNPVDLAVASGRFPGGSPPVPFVPGVEAVGTVVSSSRFAAGTRVYATGAGLGVAMDGTFGDRFLAPEAALIDLPDGIDDVRAAAFGVPGIAGWLPLTWLAPVREGESVLVLGATGAVGSVAIQAAKLLGAGSVIAAGRSPDRLERARGYGADAVVVIGPDFGERLAEASGDRPPTLVVDGVWGEPLAAALAVAARGARVVHLGQSAGPTATLLSGHVRTKQLQILGYSNFGVPPEDLRKGYHDLLGHVAAGRISLEIETYPLDRVAEAWARQAAGEGVKLVLTR